MLFVAMTSHNASTRSAHNAPPAGSAQNSPLSTNTSTSGSVRKQHPGSSRRKNHGGSSKRGRAMPQRLTRSSRSSKAMSWLEPRLLLITTGVTLFGALLQIVAISTDSWLVIEPRYPDDVLGNSSGTYIYEGNSGLWRFCHVRLERKVVEGGQYVDKKNERCEPHNFFPTADEIHPNAGYDRSHLDYTRTAIAFTIIALVVMTIGHLFAFYSLRRPRYIIKRLAALLHFMTAACLLVLNEVFVKTVQHEKEKMPERIPREADTHYGYSFVLSWIVFAFFVLAGLVFLFTSHKKKAEYADSTDALEDEPMEIRR